MLFKKISRRERELFARIAVFSKRTGTAERAEAIFRLKNKEKMTDSFLKKAFPEDYEELMELVKTKSLLDKSNKVLELFLGKKPLGSKVEIGKIEGFKAEMIRRNSTLIPMVSIKGKSKKLVKPILPVVLNLNDSVLLNNDELCSVLSQKEIDEARRIA